MADIGDISAILGLFSSSDNPEGQAETAENKSGGEGGNLFGDIDADMIIKLIEVFSKLNESDKNTELLYALKPHLRQENRSKVDMAASIMKMMTVISMLGENNMF